MPYIQKILTKDEKEQKEKRNKIILVIILAVIMIISTAGYAFFSTDENKENKIVYNNIEFVLINDGLWHSIIGQSELVTRYNPKEVENISVFGSFNLNELSGKVLYFSYDSEREGVNEILRNIGGYAERMQYVCIDECKEDFPVKNCSDNIIIIKKSEESLIKREYNCLYILAKDDILMPADAFIFRTFKII